MKTYCMDNAKDWDKGLHLLLFAVREVPNESLGFSPFELIYGHEVRGPLKLFKECCVAPDEGNDIHMLKYVAEFKDRLQEVCQVAKENLSHAQEKMKSWYDRNSRERSFSPGDKVLVLLPMPGNPLQAKFTGPYTIHSRLNSVDYVINTPDHRRGKQVCHVNMIKPYFDREATVLCVQEVKDSEKIGEKDVDPVSEYIEQTSPQPMKNSDALNKIDEKLSHLTEAQRQEMKELLAEYSDVFSDVPGRTEVLEQEIILQDGAVPVKQQPYRLNPIKAAALKEEVKYMLENDLIEVSDSPWSSPVILVPKPDSTFRMCIDFRKLNALTVTDCYPVPRVEVCIDKIGNAKFISKWDLLKGYWQVPLAENSKQYTAFVTPDNLYQCKVMAFGLKNAPSVFMRLMNKVINGLEYCAVFIDDVGLMSDNWNDHLTRTREFLQRLREAKLTVNLVKSDIGQATVTYLGYTVGQGQIVPKDAKVKAIQQFAVPTCKKHIMQFLGVIGYYRKFCPNFAEVSAPLTDMLHKDVKFRWTKECQESFDDLKQLLMQAPILAVPDYSKPFRLFVDACDVGVGSWISQTGQDQVDHPIAYFSKKLNKHQRNYSTIEKEALALILSVQHFEVYMSAGCFPVQVFSDHNPIKYLHRFKNKNQRLTRWSLFLQEYNLEINHIRGRDNIISDYLSRRCTET